MIAATLEGSEVVFHWKESTQDNGVDALPMWSSDLVTWRENARIVPTAVGRPFLGLQAMQIRIPHSSAKLFMKFNFVVR